MPVATIVAAVAVAAAAEPGPDSHMPAERRDMQGQQGMAHQRGSGQNCRPDQIRTVPRRILFASLDRRTERWWQASILEPPAQSRVAAGGGSRAAGLGHTVRGVADTDQPEEQEAVGIDIAGLGRRRGHRVVMVVGVGVVVEARPLCCRRTRQRREGKRDKKGGAVDDGIR